MRWIAGMLALGACDGTKDTTDSGTDGPPTGCVAEGDPEVFLGVGVGGAFQNLEQDAQVSLSVAPQGGFGVSVLIGTRGLQAGDAENVMASLTAESLAVANSAATFDLEAALQCKSDGPEGSQGVIYGVVVGFNASLNNDQLLEMNGQEADLTVTVTDALGNTGMVVHPVTLIVGE